MKTILVLALCSGVYAQPGWPQPEQFDGNNSPQPIEVVYAQTLPPCPTGYTCGDPGWSMSHWENTAAHGCFQISGSGVVGKSVPCSPVRPDWNRWHWSVIAFAAATSADLHSSRDLYELNPVLGRGSFGARQATVKVSLAAGLIGAEYLVIRRWPRTERAWRWVNWIAAGTTTAVAVRNYRQ